MHVGYYAETEPKTCIFCRGKGCSYCDKKGIKTRKVQVISEEELNHQIMQVQAMLKTVEGTIVEEEEKQEILEDNSVEDK